MILVPFWFILILYRIKYHWGGWVVKKWRTVQNAMSLSQQRTNYRHFNICLICIDTTSTQIRQIRPYPLSSEFGCNQYVCVQTLWSVCWIDCELKFELLFALYVSLNVENRCDDIVILSLPMNKMWIHAILLVTEVSLDICDMRVYRYSCLLSTWLSI